MSPGALVAAASRGHWRPRKRNWPHIHAAPPRQAARAWGGASKGTLGAAMTTRHIIKGKAREHRGGGTSISLR